MGRSMYNAPLYLRVTKVQTIFTKCKYFLQKVLANSEELYNLAKSRHIGSGGNPKLRVNA